MEIQKQLREFNAGEGVVLLVEKEGDGFLIAYYETPDKLVSLARRLNGGRDMRITTLGELLDEFGSIDAMPPGAFAVAATHRETVVQDGKYLAPEKVDEVSWAMDVLSDVAGAVVRFEIVNDVLKFDPSEFASGPDIRTDLQALLVKIGVAAESLEMQP